MYRNRFGKPSTPSQDKVDLFKKDVMEAAKTNAAVRTFIERHPLLD